MISRAHLNSRDADEEDQCATAPTAHLVNGIDQGANLPLCLRVEKVMRKMKKKHSKTPLKGLKGLIIERFFYRFILKGLKVESF